MTSQLSTATHRKSQSKSVNAAGKARAILICEPLRLVGLTLNQHRLARLLNRRVTALTATARAMSKTEEA